MAFDSDLRMLLQSMTKVSRKPFQNLGVQAKNGWGQSVRDEKPTTRPVTMDAERRPASPVTRPAPDAPPPAAPPSPHTPLDAVLPRSAP
jgi:hypothetical protein